MDYTKIKEIRKVNTIEVANSLLEKNWILINVTTSKNQEEFILGRII